MRAGHGDTIVIADGNFPAHSVAKTKDSRLIPAYGLGAVELLDAILTLMPLDPYDAESAVEVMQVVPGDKNSATRPPIWDQFEDSVQKHESTPYPLKVVERFEFYEHAKKAFAVVASSETAIYANVILKKGVIQPKK
jgi:L-fucose mutarotase